MEEIIGKETFDSVWERVHPIPAETQTAVPESVVLGAAEMTPITAAEPYTAPRAAEQSAVSPAEYDTPPANAAVSNAAAAQKTAVSPARSPEVEAARLREIMDVLAESARRACTLARCTRGDTRRVAECLAKSARNTIRLLNTQHFILTGETYCPSSRVSPSGSVCTALRDIAACEAEARELCAALAADTAFSSVNGACACAARQCTCRERAAECELSRLLG
ncbi:MAG: hypothetical protein LBT36_02245 [Oscillospiraceae bacterium]|jgi:hypothetical protein|nr:hypothetical protein [Oscillospiraceae bacterium]